MERKIYFHDILRAFVDAGLIDLFNAWTTQNMPDTRDDYQALEKIADERGYDVLYKDIVSGKFETEIEEP